MRRYRPKAPSQRETRNQCAAWGYMAGDGGATPVMEAPKARTRSTPKRQPEAAIGTANREWATTRGGLLRKNPRGLAGYLPPGMPVGLAFPLILDEVGYMPVVITQGMVGLKVAVLMSIEDKTARGVVAEHQQAAIDALRDAGAIAGVARSIEDCEEILLRWRVRARGGA